MNRAQRPGLARNIRDALGGEAIQLPLSMLVFLGLFFTMSETDYGLWVTVTSSAMIIGTFANLGSQELLVRNVARGAGFAEQWGVMLATQGMGAAVGLGVAVVARLVFFPEVGLGTALLLMMTNLLFFWMIEGCVRCGQALEELRLGTRARFVFALARIAGVGVFVALGSDSLGSYAVIAFPFALGGTAVALFDVARVTGTRPRLGRPERRYLAEGLPFVGMYGAQDMLAQFDRPLMNSFGLTVETGFYAVADRAVRLASMPTLAVARATSAEFFQTGGLDARATLELAKRFAKPTTVYGIVATVGMWLGVAVLGDVVPERFEPILPMLVFLAPIPMFQALQMFPANMLTGTDRQPLRMALYMAAVVVNVGANLILIPRFGWEGAAAATLVAETSLVAMLWFAAFRTAGRTLAEPAR